MGYTPGEVRPGYDAWAERVHPEDLTAAGQQYWQSVESGGDFSAEYRIVRPDGTLRWVEARGRLDRELNGQPHRYYGVIIDITDRKRAEEQLRHNEALLQGVLNASPDPIFLKDLQGRLLLANTATYAVIGKPAEHCLGKTDDENFLIPADGRALMANDRRILASGQTEIVEEVVETAYGQRCYLSHKAPFRDDAGQVIGLIGISRDVTERQQAEETLRASEARLKAVLDGSADAIFLKDREGRMLLANPTTLAIIGKPAESCIGKTDAEFLLNPEDARGVMANDRRIMETGQPEFFDETVLTPTGMRCYRNSKAPYRDAAGNVIGLIGVARDITEQKQAEAALRESEARLALAARGTGIGLFEWEIATGRTLWTEQHARLLGLLPATATATATAAFSLEYTYRDWTDRVHPDDLPHVEAELRRAMAERATYEAEYRVIWPDGSLHWLVGRGLVIADVQDQPERMLGMIMDITERKRVEAALHHATIRAEIAQEAARATLYEFTPRTGQVIRTPSFDRVLGYGPEDNPASGEAWRALIHPDDCAAAWNSIEEGIQSGEGFSLEYRVRHQDGHYVWLFDRAHVYADAHGAAERVIGMVVDITDRKQTEAALHQYAEQLKEAHQRKDEFLAMLGHELRNPLAPIRNAVQILGRLGPADPTLQKARDMIDRQVTHMTRLIDELLDATRIARGKILLKTERCDLAEIARHTVEDYRSVLEDSGLRLGLDVPQVPVWVEGDPTRLAQMVGNLLHNAGKFTEPGGQVRVGLILDSGKSDPRAAAVLWVRDSGIGLVPEMLPRVFDVFAQADRSLDRSRGGLGLGLALVKGLAELHGGHVEAHSEGLGQGAEFRFWLPLAQKPAPNS